MTHWLQVPYVSGASALFSHLMADARTSNKRIAIIGDSQEDTTGDSIAVDLSFYSWQKLGVCHESGICPPFSHGSTADSSNDWLSAGSSTSPGTKVTPDASIPPGKSVTASGTYAYGTVRALMAYKADSNALQAAGDYAIVDPSAGFLADVFLYTNSAGADEIRWRSAPVATGPSAGSYFATDNASAVTTTLDLSGSDGTAVRFRTGLLPHDASKPYAQLILGGHNGSAYVAGAEIAGCRFISQAGAGGLVWEPFSVGGYNTESISTNHADAGPMFAAMGGPEGWSAIAIGTMNNNAYTLEDTAAQYKTKLSALITLLRSWTGTTTPILLLADPPVTGSGWPAGALDKFNEYAGVQAELATELADVMAINTQRLMYDAGYDPAVATFSSDGLHPTRLGANIRASSIVNVLIEVARSAPTVAEIITAINSSTTGTNAATAAAQATTAATEIVKVPRAETALTAGVAVERQIESPLGTAVQTIAEKVNGAAS